MKKEEVEERFILAIDGGGIRGLIPALVLEDLNNILKEMNAEHSLYAYFDLIIGTSTGGIISLSLANENTSIGIEEGEVSKAYETSYTRFLKREIKTYLKDVKRGIDIPKIKDLYKNDGSKIFVPNYNISFLEVLSNKYSAAKLLSYFKDIYADHSLSSLLVPTAIVSSDLKTGKEVIFSSYNEFKDCKIYEAARATSAAPTYFDSFLFDDKCLLDGAVIANNPSLFAYSEARKLYPNCKKFHILSLSTASGLYTYQYGQELQGAVAWAKHIWQVYQSGQHRLTDEVLAAAADVEYTRIDTNTNHEKISMDDTRTASVLKIEEIGKEIVEQGHQNLENFAAKMIKRKLFDNLR